jgi:hypothetical protein
MKEAGFKSEKMDPEVIYLYAKVGYDQDNLKFTRANIFNSSWRNYWKRPNH